MVAGKQSIVIGRISHVYDGISMPVAPLFGSMDETIASVLKPAMMPTLPFISWASRSEELIRMWRFLLVRSSIVYFMQLLRASYPPEWRRTVTFDNGTELARHYRLHDLGVQSFFGDTH